MSINFKVTKQSKKCNLTQLRLNSRNNKLTGRKYRDNIVDKPESSPLNTFTTDLLNDMDLIDTIEQREDNKATTSKDINSSEDLSDEKKRLFFSYVLIKKNKILINKILDKKQQIGEDNIKVIPDAINDSVLEFLDSYKNLRVYFDEDSFSLIENVMNNKRKQDTCLTCDQLIFGSKGVHCSECKNWFHVKCEIKNDDDLNCKKWHCNRCKKF